MLLKLWQEQRISVYTGISLLSLMIRCASIYSFIHFGAQGIAQVSATSADRRCPHRGIKSNSALRH